MLRRIFWLLFAFSLAGMAASSLALFAGPSTEVALWSDWSFLGLSRPRWEALHYGMGLLLTLSGLISLFTGASRMMALPTGDAEDRYGAQTAKAWLTAIVIFVVLLLASVLMLPPGGTLVHMASGLKSWHAKSFGEPPLAGAASMTPTELAKRLSLDPAKALTNLAAHNVKLSSPDATITEIARQNGLAPAAVYETLRGGKDPRLPAAPAAPVAEAPKPQAAPAPPQLPADPPPGLGRLKLADVCEQYGLNLNGAVDKLAKSGIKASGDMTLRQIAQSNLMLPIEVYDALRGAPAQTQAPVSAPAAPAPVPAPPVPATPALPATPPVVEQPQPGTAPGAPAPVPGQVTQPGTPQAPAPAAPIVAPEGLERMTLAAFCRDHTIDTAQALAKLKAKGIVAFSDMTFRELAVENNLTAQQVMDLIVK
ncbi:hypothetical protein [Fundidesulfovibrio putealis]|uniref:hypothetical protein n=1 Tax=Fundidesulfovibrio putealis TaxID=270496 RepID=UPI0004044FD4|nr:hypothetical protein [Fundidesulfovibrio putealis]